MYKISKGLRHNFRIKLQLIKLQYFENEENHHSIETLIQLRQTSMVQKNKSRKLSRRDLRKI